MKRQVSEKEEGEIISDLSSNEDSPNRTGGFDVKSLFMEEVPFSTSILPGSEKLEDEPEKLEDKTSDGEQLNQSEKKTTEDEEADIYGDLQLHVEISPTHFNGSFFTLRFTFFH